MFMIRNKEQENLGLKEEIEFVKQQLLLCDNLYQEEEELKLPSPHL